MTSIAEVIAFHYQQIPGIQSSTAKAPRSMVNAGLPMAVVFPRASTYEPDGSGQAEQYREWEAVLFLQKAEDGVEGQFYDTGEEFREELVPNYFLARPGLATNEGPNVVLDAQFLGEDGFGLREYPQGSGQWYVAIGFRHRTNRTFTFNYQD